MGSFAVSLPEGAFAGRSCRVNEVLTQQYILAAMHGVRHKLAH
jgi:hypothetical protein